MINRIPSHAIKLRSLLVFILLWLMAWGSAMAGFILFPNQRIEVHLGRVALIALGSALLILGSKWLFVQDGLGKHILGMELSLKNGTHFLLGIVGGVMLVMLIAGVLWLLVPFHWEQGNLSMGEAILETHSYFWNNFLEELMFRGYALVALIHAFGRRKAIWILALPFGLFHLPGLGFGIEALKMVITTATTAFVFSYAYLLTGTLWTAVGVHWAMNVMLHTITGLDPESKPSLVKPVFDASWPTTYDAGFWTFWVISSIVAILLGKVLMKNRPLSQSVPSNGD